MKQNSRSALKWYVWVLLVFLSSCDLSEWSYLEEYTWLEGEKVDGQGSKMSATIYDSGFWGYTLDGNIQLGDTSKSKIELIHFSICSSCKKMTLYTVTDSQRMDYEQVFKSDTIFKFVNSYDSTGIKLFKSDEDCVLEIEDLTVPDSVNVYHFR